LTSDPNPFDGSDCFIDVAAENDGMIPLEDIKSTYQKAGEPKSLKILPITHFDIYYEPWLSKAIEEEINWFKKYL
jgi:hypothetical protein